MGAFFMSFIPGAAGGVAVAALNDLLLRTAIKRKRESIAAFYIARQMINVLYLAALYLLSRALGLDAAAILAGGAIGITLPSIFFTKRLVRINDAMKTDDMNKEDKNEDKEDMRKEREKNG